MQQQAHGRAGGKAILLGEHVVVYGRPALATGLPLGLHATVEPGAGPRVLSEEPADPRATRLVGDAARMMGIDPSRVVVRVHSEIPAGRGLGSSAALSIAVLRAMAAAAGRVLDTEATLAHGRTLEGVFHGTPSGVDPAAAALGTCFRFVRGEPPVVTPVLPGRALRLVVAYGGRARSTGAAVGALRERWQADRARHERLFDDVARVVEGGIAALEAGDLDALGDAFDRNQALLDALGVSAPEVETLVGVAKGAGALGAKLTGGGAGGAIIAIARDPDAVAVSLRRVGATALVVVVGTADDAPVRAAGA